MRQCWTIPTLPLAVYREVVAHLRQVEGVAAGLLPQTAPNFDPKLSQVGGLWLELPDNAPVDHQNRLNAILQYYGDRAQQSWQPLEAQN
ncbi:hypothetical protein E1H12_15295 [Geitlerinema sp. P-1104]|uniref:hypothetical protein n=1 Tax=Geitlerinema sp. P-1104 TaxID=2546230 RepID=UPI001476B796|nr:hypothetical protein [Geitlerinema sp. P-1104]NMG59844.1 hypothetical protein [Geitlerinema sp. P-1104]